MDIATIRVEADPHGGWRVTCDGHHQTKLAHIVGGLQHVSTAKDAALRHQLIRHTEPGDVRAKVVLYR